MCRCLTRTGESPECDCGSEYVETEAPTLLAGKYRLTRRLGTGGTGAAFLARDLRLEAEASRLAPPEKLPHGPRVRGARPLVRPPREELQKPRTASGPASDDHQRQLEAGGGRPKGRGPRRPGRVPLQSRSGRDAAGSPAVRSQPVAGVEVGTISSAHVFRHVSRRFYIMQDPGPFLRGSHKGSYGTVRKGEGARGLRRPPARNGRPGLGRDAAALEWRSTRALVNVST